VSFIGGYYMEIKILMLLVLISAICISGCTDYNDSQEDAMPDDSMDAPMGDVGDGGMEDQMPEPAAANIFLEIDGTYKEWNVWPGNESMEKGNGVHGEYVTVYVSDNAVSAAEAGGEMMPYETMVVKEGFNSDEELTGIYLMYKVKDYDPENNDWFWAAYSPEGSVTAEGQVDGCIGCHVNVQDADYIFYNV
jgi:hypothetical protein